MKYCDTCIHFIKEGLRCSLFGVRLGRATVQYFPVEYVRTTPAKMCGPEGAFHITHEEKREADLFAQKKREEPVNYDDYFGFTPGDYQVHDAGEEFDRDMEAEKQVKKILRVQERAKKKGTKSS